MKLFISFFLFLSLNVSAACSYKVVSGSEKIKWTAFKTPKKIGVSGEFKKFTISPKTTSALTIDELINQTTFDVDASSVSTANSDRDKKIISSFFTSNGNIFKIKGSVLEAKKDEATVRLILEDRNQNIRFSTKSEGNHFKMTSKINVLDFGLKPNLERITLACKALHEGITWPQVNVSIEFEIEESCH